MRNGAETPEVPARPPVRERLVQVAASLLDVDVPDDLSVGRIVELAEGSRSSISKNYSGLEHLLTVASVRLLDVELIRLDVVCRDAGLTGWDRAAYRVLGLHRWVETRVHVGELLFDAGPFVHPLHDVPIRSTVLGRQIALDFDERPVPDAALAWIAALTMGGASSALLSVLGEWDDFPQYLEVGRRIITAPFPGAYKQWQTNTEHPVWGGLFELLGKGSPAVIANERSETDDEPRNLERTNLGVPPATKRGRRRGQTDTPTLLIGSALELVESGVALESISIQELTRRVYHAPSSVYTHFESLDALFHEARKAWFAVLSDLEKGIQTSTSPLERVIRRFGVLMNDAKIRPEIYREMLFRKPRKDPWPFTSQATLDTELTQGAVTDLFSLSASGVLTTELDLSTHLRGFLMLFRTVSCIVVNQAQRAAPLVLTPELLSSYVQNALTSLLFGSEEPPPEQRAILDRTRTLLDLR